MDREELFEMLDMETGADFQYFENFADLVEYAGAIDEEAIATLILEADMKTFAEICESYFFDTLENVPDDQIDLYNLLESIKRVLIGLSQAVTDGDENAAARLADELNRFRLWFSADSVAECVNVDTRETKSVPIMDSIVLSRLSKLGEAEYRYDYSGALDYELSEYIMTYADLVTED